MPSIKNGIIIFMNMLSAFLVALGLSMDNFAVTLASGCGRNGALPKGRILWVGFCFTLAHVVMLSAGWFGGWELGHCINKWDHWIAFLMLVFVGMKMIKESLENKPALDLEKVFTWRMMIFLSAATSLDALGVGVALSLENAPFWITLTFMAGCVFVTSYSGFLLGQLLGRRFGKIMEVFGGVVLIGLGTKILLSGLGIL